MIDLEIERVGLSTLLSTLERVVALIATGAPGGAAESAETMFRNRDAVLRPEARACLLRVVGHCARGSPESAAHVVPIAYAHLHDAELPEIRAAAAHALYELIRGDRNVLPEEVLLALTLLLDDAYVSVARATVEVLTVVHIENPAVARLAFRKLALLRQTLTTGHAASDLMRDLVWAELNVSRQHDEMEGEQVREFEQFTGSPHHRIAEHAAENFSRYARHRPAAQRACLHSLVAYYQRFALVPGASSAAVPPFDGVFAEVFHFEPETVIEEAELLLDWCKEATSPQPSRSVGTLLAAVGDGRAADAFGVAATRSSDDAEREFYLGLEHLLRAEDAVRSEGFDTATERLGLVRERLAAAAEADAHDVFRSLRFAIGFVDRWAHLRKSWLRLPADAQSLTESLPELEAQIGRLPQPVFIRDETLVAMLGAILKALRMLVAWREGVRAASGSEHFLTALAHLHDASEYATTLGAGSPASAKLSRDLEEIADAVEALGPRAGIDSVIALTRHLSLPLPLQDLPAPGEWRVKSAPQPRQRAGSSEPAELLASVELSINGAPGRLMTRVVAGAMYDVHMVLEFDRPVSPEHTVKVSPVSVLSPHDYRFLAAESPTNASSRIYGFRGMMRFDHPQANGARPSK